jgi:hypothetical protein
MEKFHQVLETLAYFRRIRFVGVGVGQIELISNSSTIVTA